MSSGPIELELDSPEALAVALDGFGWTGDFRQLQPGAGDVFCTALAGEGCAVMRVDFACESHQQTLPPAGMVTFGVPVGPQRSGRFGRRELHSESINRFDAQGGMDAVSPAGFAAYTLSFAEQRLAELQDMLALPDAAAWRADGLVQSRPAPAALASLRQCLATLLAAPASPMNTQEVLSFELPRLMLRALSKSVPAPYVPANSRSRALKRALERIHAEPAAAVTVSELCRVANCSVATLERAFREQFGVGPKRYLTRCRLSAVRQALLMHGAGVPIADLAAAQGFWHMSKFAGDYRRLFGELPSQTRARAQPSFAG